MSSLEGVVLSPAGGDRFSAAAPAATTIHTSPLLPSSPPPHVSISRPTDNIFGNILLSFNGAPSPPIYATSRHDPAVMTSLTPPPPHPTATTQAVRGRGGFGRKKPLSPPPLLLYLLTPSPALPSSFPPSLVVVVVLRGGHLGRLGRAQLSPSKFLQLVVPLVGQRGDQRPETRLDRTGLSCCRDDRTRGEPSKQLNAADAAGEEVVSKLMCAQAFSTAQHSPAQHSTLQSVACLRYNR
ncbi:hypothetical protein INR49_019268 [Caranx melampygus]|nr:hypothetical protein INR49_019268 [Caranx melampygus]